MSRVVAFIGRIRSLGFWGVAIGLVVWLGNYYTVATVVPGVLRVVADVLKWPYLPYAFFALGLALLVAPWVLGQLAARGWIFTTPFDFDVRVEGAIVFLEVINYGFDTEFSGRVEQVTGVTNPTEVGESLNIPWRNYFGGRRFLARGNPRRLVLAEGDGYGHSPNAPGTFNFRHGFGPDQYRRFYLTSQPPDAVYKHEVEAVVTVTGTGIAHRVTHTVRLGFVKQQDRSTGNLGIRARIVD